MKTFLALMVLAGSAFAQTQAPATAPAVAQAQQPAPAQDQARGPIITWATMPKTPVNKHRHLLLSK